MVLCALARPRPDKLDENGEPFSGLVGCWRVGIRDGKYQSGKRKGRTRWFDHTIRARDWKTKKGRKIPGFATIMKKKVLPAVVKRMPWLFEGPNGDTVFIQMDGASPHTGNAAKGANAAKVPMEDFLNKWLQSDDARPGQGAVALLGSAIAGKRMQVTTQPARSPDLNICDLSYVWIESSWPSPALTPNPTERAPNSIAGFSARSTRK